MPQSRKGNTKFELMNMKRLALLLSVFIGFQATAQEGPIISSAIIAIDNSNDVPLAKKYIDNAAEIIGTKDVSSVKMKSLRKFYYYNGLINFRVFNSKVEAVKKLDADALDKASEYLLKSIEYEKAIGKTKYTKRAIGQIPYVANAFASRGIDKSTAEDYLGAYEDFLKTYEMKQLPFIGTTDTAMLYNAAIMAQNAKLTDKAIKLNQQLIEMDYRAVEFKATDIETGEEVVFASGKQRDAGVKAGKYKDSKTEGDIRADLYVATANLYLQAGDTVKYDKMVQEGRAKFPTNDALLLSELNKFLESQEYDKALVNLDAAIAKKPNDPSNKTVYYIKGYILHTHVKNTDEAEKAYAKAIELSNDYVEPLYMNGLIYIEKANAISGKMNKLGISASDTKKHDAYKAEQKLIFAKALPYFEKVYAIDSKDLDTLKALKEVYYKLNMREKQMKIIGEINAVESGATK